MPLTLEQLAEQAMLLPVDSRALLADSRNFMVEGGAKSEVVDLQDQEQKGLHYIFDFVSGRFAGPGT